MLAQSESAPSAGLATAASGAPLVDGGQGEGHGSGGRDHHGGHLHHPHQEHQQQIYAVPSPHLLVTDIEYQRTELERSRKRRNLPTPVSLPRGRHWLFRRQRRQLSPCTISGHCYTTGYPSSDSTWVIKAIKGRANAGTCTDSWTGNCGV